MVLAHGCRYSLNIVQGSIADAWLSWAFLVIPVSSRLSEEALSAVPQVLRMLLALGRPDGRQCERASSACNIRNISGALLGVRVHSRDYGRPDGGRRSCDHSCDDY
jgi:ABC-type phosphate transport system permease subunit